MLLKPLNGIIACALFIVGACPTLADNTTSDESRNQSTAKSRHDAPSAKHIKAALITSATRDSLIKCTIGQVSTKKGSVVYVMDNGRELAVYNMRSRPDGVKVSFSGDDSIAVPFGQELLLTRSTSGSFRELQIKSRIGYRNPAEVKVGNGIRGFIADFSITAAIGAIPPLRAKLHSTDSDDRMIAGNVLKSATIQNMVTARRGAFQPGK